MTIYQKVIAAFGVLRSSIMQRAEKSAIAPTFSESVPYSVGRLVYREDTLYRCIVVHSGSWDPSHFTETTIDEELSTFGVLRSLIMQRAEKSAIAPTFSESVPYSVGRLVYREDTLYRCIVVHSGSWDPSHFTETTIDEELSTKGGGGGGDVETPENLYARDSSGLFYKLTIEESDGIKTIAVDQNGISGVSSDDAYAKDEKTELYHKITVESVNGIKTIAVEQNGVTR